MGVEFILGASVLLQFAAALLALRLIWVTGTGRAWALIAAAVLLMAMRRSITLCNLICGVPAAAPLPDVFAEWVALLISVLMLAGIVSIAPFLRTFQHSVEAVRESARRLSTLMGNLPGMAYRCRNDRDWTMEFISQGCRSLTGYEPAELIGNRVRSYNELIHPDDRQVLWDQVQQALAERRPFRLIYRIRTAAGAEKWVWEQGLGVFSPSGELLALEGFITDITERRQAEEILRRARAEEAVRKEQQRLKQLLNLQERDRQLTSYEIHDGLAQQIAGALLKFQAVDQRRESIPAVPSEIRQQFEDGLQLLRDAMAETRRLIGGLRPPILDEAGLVAAIEYLAAETGQRSGIAIEFQEEVQFARLAAPLESTVFRIVQESLTNACRHSQSRKVRIALVQQGDRLRIEVEDWGCGFDPAQVPKEHFGLEGIRERARLFGGRAAIDSAPGQGTRITVELPIVEAGSEKAEDTGP
jgi:PAS domain S-box-containing protein